MSQTGVRPGFAYDIVKGRNFCYPFTESRRFSFDFDATPRQTINLFKTKNGSDTVIDKFAVMFDFGPFGTTNNFRCGLRANGRIMDGLLDGCWNAGEVGYGAGDQIMQSNGFVPAGWINGINDFNFLYRARAAQQITCIVENFLAGVVGVQGGIILVAGAQLAA